jgi:ankyrin repeat protein
MIDCLSQHPRADIHNQYNHLHCIRCREIGNWLFQLPEFISWMQNDSNGVFWLNGSMGSGKSVLTSYMVQDLKKRLNRSDGCIIASYFFDARYKFSASTATVLREMIQEVLQHQHHAPARERLQSILVNLDAANAKISPSQLRAYFTAIRNTLVDGKSMFLILDGLDDLDESETKLIKELIYLACHQIGSHKIKCFISSRSRWARDVITDGSVTINIDNEARARECLAYFIQKEAESLLDASCYGDILFRKLSTNPEGAFSRAVLAFRSICQADEFDEGQIQALIESLPSTLTGMYQSMLERISEKHRARARRIFACVTYAARPLRVPEVLTLMDLDMRDLIPWGRKTSPCQYEKSEYTEEDISRLTGGLIIACDDGTVNFVHLSARDYVKSQCSSPQMGNLSMSEYHAHELLTRICFHYLHSNQLKRFMEMPRECQFPIGNQSFTGYAVQYWSFHYGIAEAQSDSLPGLLHELIRENLNSTFCENCSRKGIYPGLNTQNSANAVLGIGTQVGSEKLVRMLLEMGADPNTTVNSDGETVLHIAARGGYLDVVELLLRRGAYSSPLTLKTERTPLYYAAAGGYPEVMRALLDGGKVSSCNYSPVYETFKCVPLCTAWNFHGLDHKTGELPPNSLLLVRRRELWSQILAQVSELSQKLWTAKENLDISSGQLTSKLRKHPGTDTMRGHCQNEASLELLQQAAREALIQNLLETGNDGVWKYNEAWGVEDFSAVEAVESKFQLTMQVLLDVPATHDTNAARNWGTALEVAVERGQEASIRFLLEHEAVLPPNVTIRIGQASNDGPCLPVRDHIFLDMLKARACSHRSS